MSLMQKWRFRGETPDLRPRRKFYPLLVPTALRHWPEEAQRTASAWRLPSSALQAPLPEGWSAAWAAYPLLDGGGARRR